MYRTESISKVLNDCDLLWMEFHQFWRENVRDDGDFDEILQPGEVNNIALNYVFRKVLAQLQAYTLNSRIVFDTADCSYTETDLASGRVRTGLIMLDMCVPVGWDMVFYVDDFVSTDTVLPSYLFTAVTGILSQGVRIPDPTPSSAG